MAHPRGADISLLVGRDGDELAGFCFAVWRLGMTADRDDREAGKIAITAVPSGPVSIEGLTVTADERLIGGTELHRAVGQARLLLAAALIGTPEQRERCQTPFSEGGASRAPLPSPRSTAGPTSPPSGRGPSAMATSGSSTGACGSAREVPRRPSCSSS